MPKFFQIFKQKVCQLVLNLVFPFVFGVYPVFSQFRNAHWMRKMEPARYNIVVRRYVDHAILFGFPYDIAPYTFYAFVLDFDGNTKLSYSVQKDTISNIVQIRASRNDFANMEVGKYRWTFLQEDTAGFRVELVNGIWELQK